MTRKKGRLRMTQVDFTYVVVYQEVPETGSVRAHVPSLDLAAAGRTLSEAQTLIYHAIRERLQGLIECHQGFPADVLLVQRMNVTCDAPEAPANAPLPGTNGAPASSASPLLNVENRLRPASHVSPSVTPEAAAYIADLRMQGTFEHILEHTLTTLRGLRSLRVTLQPPHDLGGGPCVLFEATTEDPHLDDDPSELEW